MQLFERLCATFLHTRLHLFPTAVSIVVKMSSPHCRMQKEGGILMRLSFVRFSQSLTVGTASVAGKKLIINYKSHLLVSNPRPGYRSFSYKTSS